MFFYFHIHWVAKVFWPLFAETYILKISFKIYLVQVALRWFRIILQYNLLYYSFSVATNNVCQWPGTPPTITLFIRYFLGLNAILWREYRLSCTRKEKKFSSFWYTGNRSFWCLQLYLIESYLNVFFPYEKEKKCAVHWYF